MSEITKKLAVLDAIDRGTAAGIFPLQTIQSMAERWGVTKNVVANWARRHEDFPRELDGLIAQTAKTPKVYAFADVERYERERGLK